MRIMQNKKFHKYIETYVGVSCVNMSRMGSKYSRMESMLIWKEMSVLFV
jgi:hypothetical protein